VFGETRPGTNARISGIETMARLTDNQILAEARRYFSLADQMQPRQE
jgi:hypothetical protein